MLFRVGLRSDLPGLLRQLKSARFIWIGLHIEPGAFLTAIIPGAILIAAAVVGKLAGTLAPARTIVSGTTAWLLAVSMVPRAEIAMIVMDQGRQMGSWAVPPELYTGMVLVCAVTSTVAPLVLRRMPGGPQTD